MKTAALTLTLLTSFYSLLAQSAKQTDDATKSFEIDLENFKIRMAKEDSARRVQMAKLDAETARLEIEMEGLIKEGRLKRQCIDSLWALQAINSGNPAVLSLPRPKEENRK